eukprot:comp17411_c0_seq1/m.16761 comp17411_c0_seq1/g.16761  ORF comp17411_c0_seq1/g.16761 comp17411_c0_seq1/m.16761 type:complete len:685 (-) comp17411_c0_seq1:248-2302(-)
MFEVEELIANQNYIMAMSGQKKRTKDIVLPHITEARKSLEIIERKGQNRFEYVFSEPLGYEEVKEFCQMDPMLKRRIQMYEDVKEYKLYPKVSSARSILVLAKGTGPKDMLISEATWQALDADLQSLESAGEVRGNPSLFSEATQANLQALKEIYPAFCRGVCYQRYLKWRHVELSVRITKDDFDTICCVGVGAFGKVYAVQKRDTGSMYAAKYLSKSHLKARKREVYAWTERKALALCDSPFVLCLKYAFQTHDELVLVMDLMNGGDLAYHIAAQRRFADDRARFYAMEILLGLEHLHALSILYRDLKPSNVLLDSQGHCRISDLGLACRLEQGKLKESESGTLGYMAPEVMNGEPYGLWVDYFSYGCTLYEMLTGRTPFRKDRKVTKEQIKEKAMKGDIDWSLGFSTEAKDLLQKLLDPVQDNRLGMKGPKPIKQHPYFAGMSWTLIRAKKIQAPFVPQKKELYVDNTTDQLKHMDKKLEQHADVVLTEDDQRKYEGFDVTISKAWQQEMLDSGVYDEVNSRLVDIPPAVRQSLSTVIQKNPKKPTKRKKEHDLNGLETRPTTSGLHISGEEGSVNSGGTSSLPPPGPTSAGAHNNSSVVSLDVSESAGVVDVPDKEKDKDRGGGSHDFPNKVGLLAVGLATLANVALSPVLIAGVDESLKAAQDIPRTNSTKSSRRRSRFW